MDLGIIAVLISFLTLIYFAIQFKNTREFIYKLPIMTRSKYTGLELLSRRILIIDIVLFLISLIVSNAMIKILLSMIIIFTVSYAVSELGTLKEYVNKKRK